MRIENIGKHNSHRILYSADAPEVRLLYEPSNHLDLPIRLEELLKRYDGTT
jgi:ATPase subunit of ABC transporter with duplicated ATPase domains